MKETKEAQRMVVLYGDMDKALKLSIDYRLQVQPQNWVKMM